MAAPKVFIDEVVRSLLIQQGIFTEHRLAQYIDIAMRGVKELNFDVAKNIKTQVVSLTSVGGLVLDVPVDFIRLLRVGTITNNGQFNAFGMEGSLVNENIYSGSFNTNGQIPSSSTVNWFANYRQGENTGGAYGLGGGHRTAYYRYDEELGQIHFSSEVSGDTDIIIEYISDGINRTTANNGKTSIHPFLEEALRTYIYWKLLQRKRNIPVQEKESARRDWFNEKRLAKSRMQTFSKEEALRTIQKQHKQSPKF